MRNISDSKYYGGGGSQPSRSASAGSGERNRTASAGSRKEKPGSEPEKVMRRSNAYAADKPPLQAPAAPRMSSAPTSPIPFIDESGVPDSSLLTSYSHQNVRIPNTRSILKE